jgi:hypothetical protein
MVDFEAICQQLNIQYWTYGKNNAEGCLTIHCPCCPADNPDPSRHGNLDPSTGKYACWRCKGSHPAVVIAKSARISVSAATELIRKNSSGVVDVKQEEVKRAERIKLPGSTIPLALHENYLTSRGFNVDELILNYGIRFTRMLEKWEGMDWGFRVIIPVFDSAYNLISFQGRDCTNKSAFRYLFPPKEKQVNDCKNVLYGSNLHPNRESVLVVEGVMDAWKLGKGAVCTFGSSVTRQQILELSKWKKVFLAFDNELNAVSHAREVAKELSALGTDVFLVDTDFGVADNGDIRDIGDLSMSEAQNFKKEILGY